MIEQVIERKLRLGNKKKKTLEYFMTFQILKPIPNNFLQHPYYQI